MLKINVATNKKLIICSLELRENANAKPNKMYKIVQTIGNT